MGVGGFHNLAMDHPRVRHCTTRGTKDQPRHFLFHHENHASHASKLSTPFYPGRRDASLNLSQSSLVTTRIARLAAFVQHKLPLVDPLCSFIPTASLQVRTSMSKYKIYVKAGIAISVHGILVRRNPTFAAGVWLGKPRLYQYSNYGAPESAYGSRNSRSEHREDHRIGQQCLSSF